MKTLKSDKMHIDTIGNLAHEIGLTLGKIKFSMKIISCLSRAGCLELKIGLRTWIEISTKKACKWPTDILKDAQCHLSSSEKCKSKPHWEIISPFSGWLLLKKKKKVW